MARPPTRAVDSRASCFRTSTSASRSTVTICQLLSRLSSLAQRSLQLAKEERFGGA